MITDTHCHLDEFFDTGRLDNIIGAAKENGVSSMIAVGTEESDWFLYDSIAQNYDCVEFTIGLHPTIAKSNWAEQISKISFFADRAVAIGEIGLDFYRLSDDKFLKREQIKIQKEAFAAQLQLAKNHNLPAVIHCREAFDDTINLLINSGINLTKVVFHCYTGDSNVTKRLIELGVYISFSGIVTYKNANEIRESLKLVPMPQLLIETDAPFLAPTPMRGQENQPAFLFHTAKYITNFLKLDFNEFCSITTANAKKFFQI